ncbi:glycosyltransferase [Roseospira navarrensis]|uniref:Glycosyltransferase n=1 Tax=Roseospira navarrensis TaxID=140058 RepID=A0A7X1ZJ71_9PROT|nr:glycosyltransferase [Roseospira navarrensis]MQX38220.1 glycosyltransferase [Roseospira navarrensis]
MESDTHIRDARAHDPFTGAATFSLRHRAFRALWFLVWTLGAAWTPPPLHQWRVALLRLFGARVAWSARVYGTTRVWYPPNLTVGPQAMVGPGVICYCMGPVEIGARAVISQRAHLCGGTHRVDDPYFQLYTRPIRIGDFAWVAAEAFVGPGVTVGEGAVLGARGVATRDLDPWTVSAGNPAQPLRARDRAAFDAVRAAIPDRDPAPKREAPAPRDDILIVAAHIPPARGYGGVAESAAALARQWSADGLTVHVVASDASKGARPTAAQAERACGCRVSLYAAPVEIRSLGFGLGAPLMIWRAVGRARAVYIAGIGTWPVTLALVICRLRGVPFVLGLHGNYMRPLADVIRARRPVKRLLYARLVQPVGNRARALHVLSPMEAEHARPYFSAPFVVAPVGVDCRALQPAPPPPLASGRDGGLRYLYVGRFAPEKSTVAMVEAWRAAARPADTLTLVGDGGGAYADTVKAMARADSRIETTGYLDRAAVLEAHRQHHLLILPSGMGGTGFESFGIVAGEALALGRPVLAARGLPWDDLEAHGAGLVFNPSPDGLADAMDRAAAWSPGAYAAACAAARAYAEGRIDMGRSALDLAEALLAPTGPDRAREG